MPPNVGQMVASSWEKLASNKPEDNIFASQWLLNRLKGSSAFKATNGGRFIEEPLEYAENTTFKSYTDLEPLDTTRIDFMDSAQYQWKEFAGTIVISEREKAFNQGEGEKIDLATAKLNNGKNSHNAILNRLLHLDGSGNSGKDPSGVQLLIPVDPTTGTVGTINAGTYAFWRSVAVLGTKAVNPFDNLRPAMRSCYNLCSRGAFEDHPTFIWSPRTEFQAYEAQLNVNERFTDKSDGEGEFKNEVIKFKGAKMAFDEDAQAATMRMANEKNLTLRYQKGYWMKSFPAVNPSDKTIDVVKILTICQLTSNCRRRLGAVTVIT